MRSEKLKEVARTVVKLATEQSYNMGLFCALIDHFREEYEDRSLSIFHGYGIPDSWDNDNVYVFGRTSHFHDYDQIAVYERSSPVTLWRSMAHERFAFVPYVRRITRGNVSKVDGFLDCEVPDHLAEREIEAAKVILNWGKVITLRKLYTGNLQIPEGGTIRDVPVIMSIGMSCDIPAWSKRAKAKALKSVS